jgi:membrane protease YdiL (CAAX protease family)
MMKWPLNNPQTSISNQRRILEITGVVLTGLGKLVFMDILQWRLPFILIVICAWTAYVVNRNKNISGLLPFWGFRSDNFKTVALRILPFGIVSVVAFVIVGYFNNTINITWHILPILILYPIWGIIQQFLVVALVAGNLRDLENSRLSHFTIIIVTALLFGLMHYPYYWLMLGTFMLALLYGYIYLKERNIFVMGLFHGWLGALFFYTVVNRDPFVEVFGKLLR